MYFDKDYDIEPRPDELAADCSKPYNFLSEYQRKQYWQAMLNMINAWSAYSGKKKLLVNATHSETRFKVNHVVKDSFGGDLNHLASRRDQLKAQFLRALDEFNNICEERKMPRITSNWCFNNIPNGRVAQSLRGKAQRRLDKAKPLEEITDLLR